MKNSKIGASPVVRPENLTETVSKIINSIITSKFSHFLSRDELFNEAFCSCFEYLNKDLEKRSYVGVIYKRAYGAISDYINASQSSVKITKNKDSKNYLYKNQKELEEGLNEGDILVRNAKNNIQFSEEIEMTHLVDSSVYNNPFEKLTMEEEEENNQLLAEKIEDFVNSNFSSKEKLVFLKRIKGNTKLKEVANDLNVSTQRVGYIQKQLCFKLKDEFNLHHNTLMCNN